MMLLLDIGNTRTKWMVYGDGVPQSKMGVCLNEDLETSPLYLLAKSVRRIVVANVAGDAMAKRLLALFSDITIDFVQPKNGSHGVTYSYASALGVDRWLSMVAAYHALNRHCLIVNAGTAVTIDALLVDGAAHFIGGLIMPGLHLMQKSLNANTAQLPYDEGQCVHFPTNTQDAIYSGCTRAIVGAIQLQFIQLSAQCGSTPQLVISGGDAPALLKNLPIDLVKHAIFMDNLVLRGLMQLESEDV